MKKSILPLLIVAGLSGKPNTVLAQQQEEQKTAMTDIFQKHSQSFKPLQELDDDPKQDSLKGKKLIEVSKIYNNKRVKPTPSGPIFYPEQITFEELKYFFEQVGTTLSDVDPSLITTLEDMVQNSNAHCHIFGEIMILYKLFNHETELEYIVKDLKRLDIGKDFFSSYFHEFQSLQGFKETSYKEFINFLEVKKELTQLNIDPHTELLHIVNDPTLRYKDLYIKLYQQSATQLNLPTIKEIYEQTKDFAATVDRYLSLPKDLNKLSSNQWTSFVTGKNGESNMIGENSYGNQSINTIDSTKEYQLLYNTIQSLNSVYILGLKDIIKQKEYINNIIYQFVVAGLSFDETITLIKNYGSSMVRYGYRKPGRLINPDLRKSFNKLGISSPNIEQLYHLFSLNTKDTEGLEFIEKSLKKGKFLEIRNYLPHTSFQYGDKTIQIDYSNARLFCTRLMNNYYIENKLDSNITMKELQTMTEIYINTLIKENQLSTDPQKTKIIKIIPTLNDEDNKNIIGKISQQYNQDLKTVHGEKNIHRTGLTHGFDPHREVKKQIESYYKEMTEDSSITLRVEIIGHGSKQGSNRTGDYQSYEFYDLLTMKHPEHLGKRINIVIVGCYSGSILDGIDPKDITVGGVYTSSDKNILTGGETISLSTASYSLLAKNQNKHNENLNTLSQSLLESVSQGDLIQLHQAYTHYAQQDIHFILGKDSPTVANNSMIFMKEMSLNSCNFVMVGGKVLIDERN